MKESIEKIAAGLEKLREKKPLIHHLTNHVVMADCADITLHIGGSPVMTMAPEEAEEMVSLADALVLNIGTLTLEYVETMIKAGKKANERGIPVLLDPVGAGATSMRTAAANRILNEVKVNILKGNCGEMSILAGRRGRVRGVDSAGSSGSPGEAAKALALRYGNCAVITGPEDWVSRGENVYRVKNGHVMLSRLVGTGCMLGSITACFAAVLGDDVLAAEAGLISFGIAAQLAAEKALEPASFKIALFDEIHSLSAEKIRKHAAVEKVIGG